MTGGCDSILDAIVKALFGYIKAAPNSQNRDKEALPETSFSPTSRNKISRVSISGYVLEVKLIAEVESLKTTKND